MIEKGAEISGKRRGRNNAANSKSLGTNVNGSNSWEEGSSSSSSDDEPGGGGMRVGLQYQAVVPEFDQVEEQQGENVFCKRAARLLENEMFSQRIQEWICLATRRAASVHFQSSGY